MTYRRFKGIGSLALAAAIYSLNDAPFMVQPQGIPKKLDVNTMPREVLLRYEVFFNGEKQRLCIIADVEQGYILRYKRGIGSMPVTGADGKYHTEHLKGNVEIKLKAVESV